MEKIIFYEDKNFQGSSYECSGDCVELQSHFDHCNSIRVETGSWMIYEQPHYMGYQYFLHKGNYAAYQGWMGFNDCIGSCKLIPQHHRSYKMMIYQNSDFGGQVTELTDDCPSLYEQFNYKNIYSCNVQDGCWIFYEHPNYKGRQYLLKAGEYKRYSDWGAMSSHVGSIKRIVF